MTATAPDLSAFLDVIRKSGLLSEKQLDRGLEVARPADGRAAADVLIAEGLLTRFQAERLLAGRSDGFLLGSYQILEPIGKRGDGRVFRARHRTMNRVVAVKLLATSRTSTPASLAAFTAQARAAAKLVHPHVVTTFDANAAGHRQYVVLEHVDGADLHSLVTRNGPLSLTRACDAIRQAALALAFAHAQGMPHGRVNPTDLLAARSGGAVKVLNFGLARLPTDPEPDADAYRAAELGPADATPAGDVFALGKTLAFLLSGRPDGAVPATVAGLVSTMTAADPAARPTAAQVAAAFDPQAADTGSIDFELPTAAQPSDGGMTSIGRLHELLDPPSPFADLDEQADTLPGVEMRTPLGTRWATPGRGPTLALMLLAGAVVLATGAAIGAVLRAAMR